MTRTLTTIRTVMSTLMSTSTTMSTLTAIRRTAMGMLTITDTRTVTARAGRGAPICRVGRGKGRSSSSTRRAGSRGT